MRKLAYIVVALAILFAGCDYSIADKVPEETSKWPDIYFCPKDNCPDALVEALSSARESIHCALFDINLKEVINVLAEKSTKMDVRVVVDNINYGKIKGENIKYDNDKQLSHNKFCIIDGNIVTTGSFNPTENGAYKNNNNLIILNSWYLAKNFEDEFIELWGGKFGSGGNAKYPIIYLNRKRIENYFCPEDDCKGNVIKVLRQAKESIYFMTFSFTDEDIADAILFNDKAEIKGVFEKTQAGSKYSQYHRLKGFGLDVRLDNNSFNMHHKVFIIDNETVITGSYNPTGAGSYSNDENILIIYDKNTAYKFMEEFWSIWPKQNK